MKIFFYLVYAFSRFGRKPASEDVSFSNWRTLVFLLVIECWMLSIIALWARLAGGLDLLGFSRWTYFLVALLLWFINDRCIENYYPRYREEFVAWTQLKRTMLDLLVAVFAVGMFATTMFLAVKVRGLQAGE